jgi:hypothetical protein
MKEMMGNKYESKLRKGNLDPTPAPCNDRHVYMSEGKEKKERKIRKFVIRKRRNMNEPVGKVR